MRVHILPKCLHGVTPVLAKLKTFSLLGIDARPVEVEVDASPAAMPKTVLVGLPEAAVKESTHRVERALVNSGFIRPLGRIVINLAPAELPKQASSFDLPIALGMLAATGQIESGCLTTMRWSGNWRWKATRGGLGVGYRWRLAPRRTTDCEAL